jgi:hypothetical protein
VLRKIVAAVRGAAGARTARHVFAALVFGLILGPPTTRADFIVNTDGSFTLGGGANATTQQNATVNAQVIIHFDTNGDVTVTLNNLLSTATDVGSSITGIKIFTDPTISVPTGVLKSTYGQLYDSPSNPGVKFIETGATSLSQGQFVGGSSANGTGTSYFDKLSGPYSSGHDNVVASDWDVTSASPGVITVLGSGQPTQAVISDAGAGPGFSNSSHTPVFMGSVGLIAGTTGNASTMVTKVTFYFGTGTDSLTVPAGSPLEVAPAPPGITLAACGLGFLGVWWLVRRSRVKAVALA